MTIGTSGYARSLALVVGLDVYQALPRLAGAARGAQAIGTLLRRRFGFEVSLLSNEQATRGAVTRQLEWLGSADRSVIYFAGRTLTDRALALYNSTPDAPVTGLELDRLMKQFDALPTRHALLILDVALTSPPAPLHFMERRVTVPFLPRYKVERGSEGVRLEGRARLTLCAGPSAWQSRERWSDEDATLFTAQILYGLRGNAADANGKLTAEGLAEYVIADVVRVSQGRSLPWAARLPDAPGDLIFQEVAPVELPRELTDGLRNGFPSLRYRAVDTIARLIERGDPTVQALAIDKLREVAAENDAASVRKMATDELLARKIDPNDDSLPAWREPLPERIGAAPLPPPSEAPAPPLPGDRQQRWIMIGVMILVAVTVIFLILHFS
ncbi:MAG: hypothetical protein ACYDBJ_08455 [Aggregatilineales bacterium]